MPAHGNQAAAHKSRVGRCVQGRQFPHRIDQQHRRAAQSPSAPRHFAAAYEGDAATREHIGDAREAILVPRHQQQEGVWPIKHEPGVRLEQLLFLTGMSAAGDPDGPRVAIGVAQRLTCLSDPGIQFQIEFHIADHAGLSRRGADRLEALGIVGGLRGDQHVLGEHAAEQSAKAPIANHRPRREPSAGEKHRHAALRALPK